MLRHLTLIFVVLGFVSESHAATWTVNSAFDTNFPIATNCATGNVGTCRLRDAIDAAVGGDMIVFNLPAGETTISLDHGQIVFDSPTGSIILDGANLSGAGQVAVDGTQTSRVFRIDLVATVDIRNLTIQNGSAGNGAGIRNRGMLTLSNCTLEANSATNYGGAIYNEDGTLMLRNCTLTDNNATLHGGGIYNLLGTITLVNSTLSYNSAANYSGGGISNHTILKMTNCNLLHNNAAGDGGGIDNTYGTMTLVNTVLAHNSAGGNGGAISSGGNSSDVTIIRRSTISDNNASHSGGGILNHAFGALTLNESTLSSNTAINAGGGVYNAGLLVLKSSTLSNNTAGDNGGGIYNVSGIESSNSLVLLNMTLSGNSASNGGGMFYAGHGDLLVNSTFADNSSTQSGAGIYVSNNDITFFSTIVADGCAIASTGSIADNGGNLDSGTSCGFGFGTSKSNATLNLGILQNNGGPTHTILPAPGSDAINLTECGSFTPSYDQRGAGRPGPGTGCDAGAVEVGSNPSERIFIDGFGPPPFNG